MPSTSEFQRLSPALALWHAFDRSAKADLFSTAVSNTHSTCLIDPITPNAADLSQLHTYKPIQAIVVTNQNHWRASAQLSQELSVPIFADGAAQIPEAERLFSPVAHGDRVGGSLLVIAIDGAAPGEIALLSEVDGGTLIVGDALINFEPYGFTFLPAKYCVNQKKMKNSLRRLLDYEFQRVLFAHGLPILSGAQARLGMLLDQ
jgi:glyoxylase-like metal-dependent hydrolase (beta-lactamase superfamily II)